MDERVYEKAVLAGRHKVVVKGLTRFACNTCSGELVSRAQMKENNRLIAEAADREVERDVDVTVLRHLRETLGLTQKDASFLFGAGESSFAKWESGQTRMSTPAALLVRCAVDLPEVAQHLARLRGFALQRPTVRMPAHAVSSNTDLIWVVGSDVAGPDSGTAFPPSAAIYDVRAAHSLETIRGLICKLESSSSELDDESEWMPATSINETHALQSSPVARFNH